MGRHSEGVSHVPACPWRRRRRIVNTRGLEGQPPRRSQRSSSGSGRHGRSRNSRGVGGTARSRSPRRSLRAIGASSGARPPFPRPRGRFPPLRPQFPGPVHLTARSRRSPARRLRVSRLPAPPTHQRLPARPRPPRALPGRAPPALPRAPACFHLLWPRGRSVARPGRVAGAGRVG